MFVTEQKFLFYEDQLGGAVKMTISKIGRYEIIDELGRGGMATVYRAYDPRFEREVAIKVLPGEFLHEPTFRTRFEREAKAIASLEHPAIVPVYDFGEENRQPYLVMRLMSGGSLADKLAHGPMGLDEIANILNRLASALDYAHAAGIIHRDLKPGNILFDQLGNPYLSDFGIVKLSASSATSLTHSGGALGTPAYMSPEQARAIAELDGRSDIYTMGVILYEMLTGKRPYQADTPMGLAMMHVLDPVPRILEAYPKLPAGFQTIIDWVMAKDRADRCPTAAALATAVNQLTAGKPVFAGARIQNSLEPTIPFDKPVKPVSSFWLVGGGLLLMGALILGAIILVNNRNRATVVEDASGVVASVNTPTASPTRGMTATATTTPTSELTATQAEIVAPLAELPTLTPTPPRVPSPTIAPSLTPEPQLRVIISSVNVRNGPGTNYTIVGALPADSIVRVLARNHDASWYNIEFGDGRAGWLAAVVTESVHPNSLDAVHLAVTIPVPPTFTPTPTPIPPTPIPPTPIPPTPIPPTPVPPTPVPPTPVPPTPTPTPDW